MTARKSENTLEAQEVNSDLSLGRALATLDARANGQNTDLNRFGPSYGEFLSSLRERRDELRASPGQIHDLYQTIPKHGCDKEEALLAEEPDYLLVYLTNDPHAAKDSTGDYLRLFEHMNNCFMCFEEYCRVHRDYCLELQELSGNGANNNLN